MTDNDINEILVQVEAEECLMNIDLGVVDEQEKTGD